MQISAEKFYHDFKQAMKEDNIHQGETYLALYKLKNRPKAKYFTNFINNTIIPGILDSYGYRISHEYFRIDVSGWVTYGENIQNEAKAIGLKPHLWDLMIAIEHENNPRDWNDEVMKLAHIRCPLKVVIGYNGCNHRDTGDAQKLSFIGNCLQQLKCFQQNPEDRLLIILGNCKDTKGSDYHTFDYRGYLYDHRHKGFQRIG